MERGTHAADVGGAVAGAVDAEEEPDEGEVEEEGEVEFYQERAGKGWGAVDESREGGHERAF